MVIKKPDDVGSSEITDESTYLNRRRFLRAGALAASTVATGAVYRYLAHPSVSPTAATAGETAAAGGVSPPQAPPGEELTPLEDISNYNNFYEFSTDKADVAYVARDFVSTPWAVSVEGLCARPKVFDLDELKRLSPPQERVYRLRCVEGWSMVIPWLGFPLADLLKQVEPLSQARYVEFLTLKDPARFPLQKTDLLRWPYAEGLRLDEAMHPLTLMATGLYGRDLPPQNGAPIRLVVPWKYGFKSAKSIVTIRLVADQPATAWNVANAREYGFYSNVNPEVDHPRWSQATERRVGEFGRRSTLMFNGYADQVAGMYSGMDLKKFY